MGLSIALSNALTGLNVNQQALTVLSQNIANANTPGYSRQNITQQSVSLDGAGAGVSISDVSRRVDEYLTRAVQAQSSDYGKASVMDDYNTRIQLMIGQPGSQNSLDAYINGFFNSIQSLAQTPQNTTLQQSTVNAGVGLANQISSVANGIKDLQFRADQDINTAINAVNNDLRNIYDLNASISANTSLGKSVADLQDRRDELLKDISQYMNVTSFVRDNGSININAGTGLPLLDDNLYEIGYSPTTSASAFVDGLTLFPISIYPLDPTGARRTPAQQLVPGGLPENIVSPVTGGKIAGLLAMRDQELSGISAELEQIAAQLRDQVNALHNAGTGFPGVSSLTGTRPVNGVEASNWGGSIRIGLFGADGQPIASPYADETNGVPPLNLDLSSLSGGAPTTQDIIDAINQYYGVPKNKVELGNLNNIQLVSATATLPGVPPQFSFGFDLSNLSGTSSSFYITDVEVTDNAGAPVSTGTLNVPAVDLASTATYITTEGSSAITVNTAGVHTLVEGDTVYIPSPTSPATIGGISSSVIGGFYKITNVTSSSFQIQVSALASQSASTDVTGQKALPPYADVPAGDLVRTNSLGLITADLSANIAAPYYNVTATVAVNDGSGNIKTSQITYRVNNQQANMFGLRVPAQAATNDGDLISSAINRPLATATLVDAQGKELPKVGGKYITTESGYLKIAAYNSNNMIVVDSLDSVELGRPNGNPPQPGTNRGFSHYFDLNDFFVSNIPTATGDTVSGSALRLRVNQNIQNNPGLLSLGQMTRRPQSNTPGAPYNYTYELNPGDNSVIQKMAGLSLLTVNFGAAGGLGATGQTFAGYAGQIISATATNAANAKANSTNAQTLLEGYAKNASSLSGVNLDTELANTVIYQNAYAASARVITVANSLFETLLSTFGR